MTSVEVRTSAGVVRGTAVDGRGAAFLGIPYAEPPWGSLRFAPPVRRSPWTGTRLADAHGQSAPQLALRGPLGELFAPHVSAGEDCLNLNVWTPDPAEGAGLPVLVWIHGGGFVLGAGSQELYDGSSFARDGVVCVTINYRLGAEGFLYVEGAPGAGNFGLLDQVAALEWVQQEIAAFGGDPGNVTVAGESAGGMSVGGLLAMPAARGLFQRAVAQSGAAHNAIDIASAGAVTDFLRERLGHGPSDLAGWRELPIDVLSRAGGATADACLGLRHPHRFGRIPSMAMPMAFQPVHGTPELPHRPIDAVAQGSAKGVELLVGATAEEMVALLDRAPAAFGVRPGEDLADDVLEVVASMRFASSPTSTDEVLDTYRRAAPEASNLRLLGLLNTDAVFRMPAVRLAEAQHRHGLVHAYELTWPSPGRDGIPWGAGHALDLPLVFDTCDTELGRFLTGGDAPQDLIASMHGSWVRFATDGDLAWPAFDPERRATMIFDVPTDVVDDPSAARRLLWEGLLT